jgi:hypothetical protein
MLERYGAPIQVIQLGPMSSSVTITREPEPIAGPGDVVQHLGPMSPTINIKRE